MVVNMKIRSRLQNKDKHSGVHVFNNKIFIFLLWKCLSAGTLASGWFSSCSVWERCCPGTSSWQLPWYDITSCLCSTCTPSSALNQLLFWRMGKQSRYWIKLMLACARWNVFILFQILGVPQAAAWGESFPIQTSQENLTCLQPGTKQTF